MKEECIETHVDITNRLIEIIGKQEKVEKQSEEYRNLLNEEIELLEKRKELLQLEARKIIKNLKGVIE